MGGPAAAAAAAAAVLVDTQTPLLPSFPAAALTQSLTQSLTLTAACTAQVPRRPGAVGGGHPAVHREPRAPQGRGRARARRQSYPHQGRRDRGPRRVVPQRLESHGQHRVTGAPWARLEMRRACGGSLTSRHTNPLHVDNIVSQVRTWRALEAPDNGALPAHTHPSPPRCRTSPQPKP